MKKTIKKEEILKELERLSITDNLVFSSDLSDFNLNKIYSNYRQNVNIRLNEQETKALNEQHKIVLVRECILTFEIVKNEDVVNVECVNDFGAFEKVEKVALLSEKKKLQEENENLKEMIKQLQAKLKA